MTNWLGPGTHRHVCIYICMQAYLIILNGHNVQWKVRMCSKNAVPNALCSTRRASPKIRALWLCHWGLIISPMLTPDAKRPGDRQLSERHSNLIPGGKCQSCGARQPSWVASNRGSAATGVRQATGEMPKTICIEMEMGEGGRDKRTWVCGGSVFIEPNVYPCYSVIPTVWLHSTSRHVVSGVCLRAATTT